MTSFTNKRGHGRRPTSARRSPARFAHASSRADTGARRAAFGLAAACVALLVIALVIAQRCDSAPYVAPSASTYVSPYDWSGLSREGDRLSYFEDGQEKSQVGVDVSDHQGTIDWQAVAADGIDFAFVRAGSRGYTEGGLIPDARFAENVDNAASAGLDVGTYFFSQATTVDEAREEADLVLSLLDGRALALPVVFDHEPVPEAFGRANNLDGQTLTACALAFCERIEAAGYATMLYGNAGDMARYDRAALGDRPIWFAEYDATSPHAQFDFAVWQYTNGGSVAGINAAVDLNLRMIH